MEEKLTQTITGIFFPVLNFIFSPMNGWLSSFYMPWARIVAVGLFVGAMLWVYFGLNEKYVNLDAPGKHFWTDLRLWTVLSMLPHVLVYLYF